MPSRQMGHCGIFDFSICDAHDSHTQMWWHGTRIVFFTTSKHMQHSFSNDRLRCSFLLWISCTTNTTFDSSTGDFWFLALSTTRHVLIHHHFHVFFHGAESERIMHCHAVLVSVQTIHESVLTVLSTLFSFFFDKKNIDSFIYSIFSFFW